MHRAQFHALDEQFTFTLFMTCEDAIILNELHLSRFKLRVTTALSDVHTLMLIL